MQLSPAEIAAHRAALDAIFGPRVVRPIAKICVTAPPVPDPSAVERAFPWHYGFALNPSDFDTELYGKESIEIGGRTYERPTDIRAAKRLCLTALIELDLDDFFEIDPATIRAPFFVGLCRATRVGPGDGTIKYVSLCHGDNYVPGDDAVRQVRETLCLKPSCVPQWVNSKVYKPKEPTVLWLQPPKQLFSWGPSSSSVKPATD